MKRICLALVTDLMVFTLPACETMKGRGKDEEDAGELVQDKANEQKAAPQGSLLFYLETIKSLILTLPMPPFVNGDDVA